MTEYDEFLKTVWKYYRTYGRLYLPWRLPDPDSSFDAYKILVSEVMLQQTQVPRVIPKYQAFLRQFPTVRDLAGAPLGAVLVAWQGLGYNRRAKYLWQAAQMTERDFNGVLPRQQPQLEQLPGVGRNTAGAIMAYAFNQPVVFIETNIRTVFIHHFFREQTGIADAAIRELVDETLNHTNPREWYWALMDYGSYLKQTVGNVSRVSGSYTKQSRFYGSLRQLRGRVLRLLAGGPKNRQDLMAGLADERLGRVLDTLEAEGLVVRRGSTYRLP